MTLSPGSGKRLEHEPWEHRDLSDLCRKLPLSSDFDVFQLCWQPDYDRFFFEQLKKRTINIFLFRGEFIFELARTAAADVPQRGNATYVFARPSEIWEFVGRYATTTRDDIRRTRGNIANRAWIYWARHARESSQEMAQRPPYANRRAC